MGQKTNAQLMTTTVGGVIVHDDIQLCQYLWTEENGISVKLNDFNRAEIMLWDETAGKYCRYKNGRGHGDVSVDEAGISTECAPSSYCTHFLLWRAWQWRAPEEYKDRPLDEKIDIWSLGKALLLVDHTYISSWYRMTYERRLLF